MHPTAQRPPRPGVSSYDPARNTAGALPAELARLEAQAALTFPEELRLLRDLGLTEIMAGRARRPVLLEVGAGTGALTRRLVAALPGAAVIALDADATLLAHLPGGHLPGGDMPRPVCADAYALPLADGSADAIVFRYVLQHLTDPRPVLLEARRVLRPGGRVYVIDVDGGLWGLAEPADPALASVYTRAAAAQRDAGGDRLVGRKLSALLRAAGFQDVAVRPFAVTSDDHPVDDFAPHLGPGRLVPLVETGTLSLADLALATAGWARFRANPDAWVMLLGLLGAGQAPPGRTSPAS
ncbi:MAG TPA: methyltransferase domain-containing protein [Streptosporangiaceae bacterium]|jgi:SAM-dependent methyltransferase